MNSYLASGDLGDILASMPVVRALGGGVYYLCSRPITKPMTPVRFAALKPLLEAQPYIDRVEMHQGQKIDYDFTGFRKNYRRGPGVNLTTIQAGYINTSMLFDMRSPWLEVPDFIPHGRPVIARSPRYNVKAWQKIWPLVLEDYPDPLFIGLPEEHYFFEQDFGKVEYRETKDFLEIAKLIKGSSIFIGNQSSPNAVAEGLKHRSIQETNPEVADVIYPRPNGYFVSNLKQYKAIPKEAAEPFALMLQIYEGNTEMAINLVDLIAELNGRKRGDIEFIISSRFDTPSGLVQGIANRLIFDFGTVFLHQCSRRTKGWPSGCNDQWHDSMGWVCSMRKQGKIKSDGIFTFEPDCLPLRADWMDCLKADWRAAKAQGKLLTGHLASQTEGGEPSHINGNLIVSTEINKHHPPLVTGSSGTAPWDIHHRKWILAHGCDAPHIYQTKRLTEFTEDDFQNARKGENRPAIWHGIKDPRGIEIAREALFERENPLLVK